MNTNEQVVDAPIIHVGEQATNTTRHTGEQVVNTTMNTNEQVVDAPIIHVGEQATNTTRHTGEHVANTLKDDKVDKVAEMDVVATEDLGFGNEDLDCGMEVRSCHNLVKKN
jgi:hypothetical protein